MDKWLISNIQQRVQKVTENLESWKTRAAAENAFFEAWNDLRWYFRRTEKPNSRVLKEVLQIWVHIMTPFTPHICQEIWSEMGKKGFILNEAWPTPDETKIDLRIEEAEILIKALMEDTQSVLRAIGITPKKVHYYTAAPWKWKAYLKTLERSILTKLTLSDLMKELMKDPEFKKMADKVAKFAREIVDEVNRMPHERKQRLLQVGIMDEKGVLSDAKGFFKREFNAEISIYDEGDPQRYDPGKRAQLARPYRPAIFIE